MFAQDSIDLLVKSGISFKDHETQGIDPVKFGELIMTSGLVLEDRVVWTSFHSGYDYGYLLKVSQTTLQQYLRAKRAEEGEEIEIGLECEARPSEARVVKVNFTQ